MIGAACLAEPTEHLFISQDRFRPAVSRLIDQVEHEGVAVCRSFGCPNPYVGIETVKGPREIWYLTAATTQAQMDGFKRAYEQNKRLSDALAAVTARRKPLLARETSTHMMRRAHPKGEAGGWNAGCGRFLVVGSRIGTGFPGRADFVEGASFAYSIAGFRTLGQADAAARNAGPGARVFRIRTDFSIPAEAWARSDPSFWRDRSGTRGK